MTKLPHESWNVKAADGPKYHVSPRCSNPFCGRHADHAHHIWRRSFIVGDVAWVELRFLEEIPPLIVQNKCGLCAECHDSITRDVFAIKWEDGVFVWEQDGWAPTPLDPQPERLGAVVDSPAPDPHGEHDSAEVCPTCRRRKRKPLDPMAPQAIRKRQSWNLTVPDDAENGAVILDELCDEIAVLFGHEDYATKLKRYYTVVQAFVLILQNQTAIVKGTT